MDSSTITIPILSPVCAGTSLPEDWQNWEIYKFRDVRTVEDVRPYEKIVGIPVDGDSLKKIGIFHGDILITKLTSRYKAGKLCVWQTPHGRTAKFAQSNPDGTVTLHNKNGWSKSWASSEIRLIGVVVRVERDLE